MWKPMLAGTVALALSGSSLVLAQQRPAPATPQTTPSPAAPSQSAPASTAPSVPKATPQKPDAAQGPTAEERRAAAAREEEAEKQAELEGRIASLKGGLMLSDEQAKSWPAFEKAYREFAKLRAEQWNQFRNRQRSDNPIENMEARADFAIRRGTAMKEFADAAMPLYQSLDQDQQRRFRREGLRGMMMAHRGYGRDGGGPRWRDRDDDGRGGYGPRWGGRGYDDDGGCDGGRHGHHRWHHRGEGMMGPGGGMMGPRSGWRDRDDDDRRGGYSDDQRGGSSGDQRGAYSGDQRGGYSRDQDDDDDDRDGGGSRGGSSRTGPDEERF